uniref:Uncharacterized protein n=1 Tax=Anguilla anguilla TaxID=7936 RepID=A0A0E9U0S0_ANGAN
MGMSIRFVSHNAGDQR